MPRAPLDIMRVITPMMARGEVLPMSTRSASAARRNTYCLIADSSVWVPCPRESLRMVKASHLIMRGMVPRSSDLTALHAAIAKIGA